MYIYSVVLRVLDMKEGEGETRCRYVTYSGRKAPRGPPGLTSPSKAGRFTIKNDICFLNIVIAGEFGI